MFRIKRTFGINHDWLHGWDDQFGYKGAAMPAGMKFTVLPVN